MCEPRLRMAQGKVVTGEWFWGREREKQLFIQRLEEDAHQLLVAQRRMGKTSLMAEVARIIQDHYICLFVDLQKSNSSADAIVALCLEVRPYQNLWEKVKGVFGNVLDKIVDGIETMQIGQIGVTLRAGLTAGDWETKGNQVLDVLSESEKPVVIFFDEVPILVNHLLRGDEGRITLAGRRLADEFMSWLRKNSVRHQGHIRFVITGSIGLEPILHQAGLSATINNFVPFELSPWENETAIGCIRALAAEYQLKLAEGVPEKMVEKLGCCIPHHVQMFFSHVHEQCVKRGVMTCSLADVEDVYSKNMLSVRGHVELVHYEERLRLVLEEELCTLALDMLTQAAVTGCLTSEDIRAFQREYPLQGCDIVAAQKDILFVLEHDGYLRQEPKGYVFVSRLLQDWWKKRHQQFFTPVLERN